MCTWIHIDAEKLASLYYPYALMNPGFNRYFGGQVLQWKKMAPCVAYGTAACLNSVRFIPGTPVYVAISNQQPCDVRCQCLKMFT